MNAQKSLVQVLLAMIAAGALVAVALAPVAGVAGAAVKRLSDTMQTSLEGMISGWTPGVTTINDATGNPIAHVYNQRRYPVESEDISQAMKDAIVAIEDRRFYEHDGVDFQGTARAAVTNLLAGGVAQGASTLNQQYVKNYLVHVTAKNADEQHAATEQSVGRKLREMQLAAQLDKALSKDEILTRYLNLVPFGNRSFGIEAAARTYFGISAAELNPGQAAMLAGMVQSSEYLNPYNNTDEVVARRNLVLNEMVNFGVLDRATADSYASSPLGVLETPATLPNGCIAAGDAGFFCDYALTYLKAKGITEDEITNDALTVNTTLDPEIQTAAHETAVQNVSPTEPGVAEVINVVAPGQESHDILAMTSSRDYGLDLDAGQTYLPQPTSLVGNGAGSVFKVFTAAAAMEQGRGLDEVLPVPTRYEAEGLGSGGAANCPPNRYCVENAANYPSHMTMEKALALSPNTPFVQLIEQVGVPEVVDMSVRLGLRSYLEPGTFNEEYSIADYFKKANLGSYTLGPTAVNPLELANVGATLGSSGRWCEPNPIQTVFNSQGDEIALERPDCEQVLDPKLADSLSAAMVEDVLSGTASRAAKATGFRGAASAKTGTTESNQSSAFLGFNNEFAAAPYIFNDGTTTSPLCTSPVRQCPEGSLFGGTEPARSYFELANRSERARRGTIPLGATEFRSGAEGGVIDRIRDLTESQARSRLAAYGLNVASVRKVGGGGAPRGTVVGGRVTPDRRVDLYISDGSGRMPANRSNSTSRSPQNNRGNTAPALPSQEEIDQAIDDFNQSIDDFRRQFGF